MNETERRAIEDITETARKIKEAGPVEDGPYFIAMQQLRQHVERRILDQALGNQEEIAARDRLERNVRRLGLKDRFPDVIDVAVEEVGG